jgi:hypothetical protein
MIFYNYTMGFSGPILGNEIRREVNESQQSGRGIDLVDVKDEKCDPPGDIREQDRGRMSK